MIIDAPFKLPNAGRYFVLGETGLTTAVADFLQHVRPGAEFADFVSDPAEAGGAPVLVCDASVPHADELIADPDQESTYILPLPIGDMWAWWEFAKRMPPGQIHDDNLQIDLKDFGQMLVDMGRAVLDEGSGKFQIAETSYLSGHPDIIGKHSDEILTVLKNLSDDASRQTYSTLVTGEPQEIWARYAARVFQNVQYFEYIDYRKCEVVINGGVFDGWEMPFFTALLPKDAVVHNIDPLGHDFLSDYAKSWMKVAPQQYVEHRFALSNEAGEMEFNTDLDGQVSTDFQYKTDNPKPIKFPVRSLNDYVDELGLDRLDLIKLDLEGSDGPAIVGALDVIRKYRPHVAVSIYHHVSDFWNIPRLLIEAVPNYDFHMGHYSFERWETIVYGIPRERSKARA